MPQPLSPPAIPADGRRSISSGGNAALFLLLLVLATAFYLPSMRLEFIYDDYPLVVNAPPADSADDYWSVFTERHWKNLPYYRPLARLTMVVQKSIHGNRPGPFHAFNAVLMGIACGLCFLLLKSPALGIPAGFAFWAALIFALHPLSSSTVYPVCSGRETLLPATFSLAAVIFWLRGQRRDRILAFAFFACALFSKEQAVVIPAMFILADLLGLGSVRESDRNWTSMLRRHVPSVLILLVYFLIRWRLFRETSEHQIALWEQPAGPMFSLLYALQAVFVPFVELVYEPPIEVWLSSWRMAIALFLAGAALLLAFRQGKTARRVVLFCLGWIGLALLPTANLLKQEASFAERYLLLSLVGVLGIAGTLAAPLWRRTKTRQIVLGLEIIAVLVLGAISFHRGGYYRDDIAFHEQWIRTNPASPHAHRSLGWAWLERGDLNRAERHLRVALQIDPDNAEIWNNLGRLAQKAGDLSSAERFYRQALVRNPHLAICHNNLATVLAMTDRLGEAERHFQIALEISPRYSEAHNGLGIVLVRSNQPAEGLKHFKRAAELDPRNLQAQRNCARLLQSLGMENEAQIYLNRARQIQPQ